MLSIYLIIALLVTAGVYFWLGWLVGETTFRASLLLGLTWPLLLVYFMSYYLKKSDKD